MNGDSGHVTVLSMKDFNSNGFAEQPFYSYEILKNTTNLPHNVDPTRKEVC